MILYLHGFLSAPTSRKVLSLRAYLAARGQEDALWCEQLPVSPRAAIAMIEQQIERCATAPVLIGSSLGAYYATWLAERHDLKAVLLNPAVLAPLTLERHLGPQENLYTGERFELTQTHLAELRLFETAAISRPERYWLLVETGDEVLDYRHAVAHYAGARQTVLPGGNHRFSRWADYVDEIVKFAGLG
jgi:predicted esterase YcpF (UPF0227 family)